MAKQLVSPIERHIEKVVVGIAAILLLGVIAKYLVTSPNQMEVDGVTVWPGTIDQKVTDKGSDVRRRIQNAQPADNPLEKIYPDFVAQLDPFAGDALAGEREATQNPTGSLLDAGVWVSWGSDGAPYGPRVSLWTGITRKGWDDEVYGPEEAVSREEAVRLHIWGGAYQTFSEDVKGTIAVGKYADFVVVGEDFFTVDADRIRYMPILKTIVCGKEIYSAQR